MYFYTRVRDQNLLNKKKEKKRREFRKAEQMHLGNSGTDLKGKFRRAKHGACKTEDVCLLQRPQRNIFSTLL